MSINNKIIKFFIFILILDLSLSDIYDNRHENFTLTSNCNKDGEEDNTTIDNPDECFSKKPGRKWKCCYFEYNFLFLKIILIINF